jgi:NADPH:quinone reductase-like Zn-dependent oxidoreductase
MKAIVHHRYGPPTDVLRLEDLPDPVVGDDDVLVRVRAAGVNAADWHLITGAPYVMRGTGFPLRGPKDIVPGWDVAGEVETVGGNVTSFQPGDEVFGWCRGSFAEYVSAPADCFVAKPEGATFEQAAAIPVAAVTALQALRDGGRVGPGHKVLITGASGGVGTFAVQIAKTFGAEVTAVCSTRNMEMVRSIGADHVVDYTREDFTRAGIAYDVVVDIAGLPSLSGCRRSLTDDGVLVMITGDGGPWLGPLPRMAMAAVRFAVGSRRLRLVSAKETAADLTVLADLVATGRVVPVIDRTYPLADTPEAVRYVEEGHTRGKVVITV